MTDPPRLLDESPGEVETLLLTEARAYRAESHTRAKTLAALGLVASAATLAKSSAAGTAVSSLKGWLVAGLVATVGAAGVTIAVMRDDGGPAAVAPAVSPSPPGLVTSASADPEPAEAPPEPAPAPSVEAEPRVAAPALRGSSAKPSLSDELAALDAASAALRSGNGARALRLLDVHARKFPRGRMRLEAEVLRIEALAQAGQRGAAAGRARAFLERHPNSVLAPRVRRYAGK